MAPTLSEGDILFLRKRAAQTGEIVVIHHPRLGIITKRLLDDGKLSGDSPNSTSSAELGSYDPATLIGVAVVAITPSGLRRLSARQSGTHA